MALFMTTNSRMASAVHIMSFIAYVRRRGEDFGGNREKPPDQPGRGAEDPQAPRPPALLSTLFSFG